MKKSNLPNKLFRNVMVIQNNVLIMVLEQNISFVYPNLEWTHLPSLTLA